MAGRVEGRVAIVTGAAKGIGTACARRLAEEGSPVALADIDEVGGTALAAELEAAGGFRYPASQTPWQEIQRAIVAQFDEGMVLKPAVKYRSVADQVPRDNH